MTNGLTRTKLGNLVVFINGGAWNQSEYVQSGIPVTRVTDCKNGTVDLSDCKYLPIESLGRYAKHQLACGDLVIATVGSHPTQPDSVVGRPIVVPQDASGSLLNQNAVCIRPIDDRLHKKFLVYLGQSPAFREYIVSCARGSANQVRMAIGLLKEMPVAIPVISHQRKIAAILSAYDDLIENNRRRIEILEEMARRIYREWFVEFRFPGHENVKFVDSPLGEIPAGWKTCTADTLIANHIGGGWGQEQEDEKHRVPAYVMRGTDIPNCRTYNSASCPYRYHTESNLRSRRLNSGDIVMEVSGGGKEQAVGRSILLTDAHIRSFDDDIICASFCKRIQVDDRTILPVLFWMHLDQIYKDGRITQYQVQSTGIKNFKFAVFLEKENFVVGTVDVQSRFSDVVAPILDLAANLGLRNVNLAKTRDLLLPRLISGELDVSDLPIDCGVDDANGA